MKFVFVFSGVTVLRHLDQVILNLLYKNHDVILITDISEKYAHKNIKIENLSFLKKFKNLPFTFQITHHFQVKI